MSMGFYNELLIIGLLAAFVVGALTGVLVAGRSIGEPDDMDIWKDGYQAGVQDRIHDERRRDFDIMADTIDDDPEEDEEDDEEDILDDEEDEEDDYDIGYGIGYERGYDDGHAAALTKEREQEKAAHERLLNGLLEAKIKAEANV
jgi:hypothetical protein